jgi:hypothetical protein
MTSFTIKDEQTTFSQIIGKIERIDHLIEFTLQDVTIDGDHDDMLALAKFIRGLTLESVTLRNIKTTNSELDLTQIISMLLIAVGELQFLCVENCNFKLSSVLACIAYASSLTTLQLPRNNLTDEDSAAIAQALIKSLSIESIDLRCNGLSGLGCHAFSETLKKNNIVNSVNVEGNGNTSLEECSSSKVNSKLARAA